MLRSSDSGGITGVSRPGYRIQNSQHRGEEKEEEMNEDDIKIFVHPFFFSTYFRKTKRNGVI